MKVFTDKDPTNLSHSVRMTRYEAVELAQHLMRMVSADMRLNDNDETNTFIPPPPAMMIGENYKAIMFSIHRE